MNLKEAFRYQNFIENTFDRLNTYFMSTSNLVNIKQEHMKKKANPDAEDEIVDTTTRQYDADNRMMILFMLDLLEERTAITNAITRAKQEADFPMDSEIYLNKMRQQAAACFSRIARIRPSETMTKSTDFKFNAEGNQVPYTYDVKVVQTIDFDREMVKGLARKLQNEADEKSTAIDQQIVNTAVRFYPKYQVSGTFEDAIETFVAFYNTNKHAV